MTKDTFFKGFESYSLRAVLSSQENWEKGSEISQIHPPVHVHGLPYCQHPPQEKYIYYHW